MKSISTKERAYWIFQVDGQVQQLFMAFHEKGSNAK